MPTYRSINIALHSQFDIQSLPEYYPHQHTNNLQSLPSDLSLAVPPFVDDSTSTCSVHIPVLPGSQFWVAYSVSPPVPEEHYFLFKLYVDGERVMSWSTGSEEAWRGKCMFGLFESQAKDGGALRNGLRGRAEKRALCFAGSERKSRKSSRRINDQSGVTVGGRIEIKVHRAWGRKRVERKMEVFEETALAKGHSGVSLINAGRAGPEQPKRFYKFALIDPIDQPFATFCYHYRTWEQLRDVGLLDQQRYAKSEENDMSVIEPIDVNAIEENTGGIGDTNRTFQETPISIFQVEGDGKAAQERSLEDNRNTMETAWKLESEPVHSTTDNNGLSPRSNSVTSGIYIPRGAPGPRTTTRTSPALRRRGPIDTYRLSMPPSIKLVAPGPATQPLPLPQKNDFLSSTAYRPHPAYPVEEWTIRTPSPVESIHNSIDTPLERGKGLGLTGAGLMGVISSTWKRSVSGTQAPKKNYLDDESCSISH